MKIEESKNSGFILVDCLSCGNLYEIADFRNDQFANVVSNILEQDRTCPACEMRKALDESAEEDRKKKERTAQNLPELVKKSGIPVNYSHDRNTGELFAKPPVYFTAQWFWLNRHSHLLLSGETGCGKSTSACFVAAKLLLEEKKIRYTSLRRLLADWRSAKTSDQSYAAEKMLSDLFGQDIVIIDEVIGKARVSSSGEELLFEILESVNCGSCHARIWLLGNFYSGSIEDTFSDPAPVRRRLQENFICAFADKKTQKIERLTVWQE
ncbi:MAG: ATP-binding protein [Lentisphaeria bacterium]|nr:ATP-binding protein [Lentisphaeria bacterium]